MVNTKNEDIVSKYFDLVQNEIKKLISQDKEIKPNQVETFNNEIFNQPEEIQAQIRLYIDKATMNDLDIKKIAKQLYDKFKMQVKNNIFNQDDVNNVPNPMLGERRFIKTFEQYCVKEELEYQQDDLDDLLDKLEHMLDEAKYMINNLGFGDEIDDDELPPEDAIIILTKINTPEAIALADTIDELLDMWAEFDVESNDEKNKNRYN
jgi:hypothetical protein